MDCRVIRHTFEKGPPKNHPRQIWFSSFRGEDLNVTVYDARGEDGHQVMAKGHVS